jgi:predicted Zn-dependent protease
MSCWLVVARGRSGDAEQEFRRAILSATLGYARTSLELARVLLRVGRAREAVLVLQPALRRGLEASNLYVTRTWRRSDQSFRIRLGTATRRLAALDRAPTAN